MIVTNTKYSVGFWFVKKFHWGNSAGGLCISNIHLTRDLVKSYKYKVVCPDQLSHWVD